MSVLVARLYLLHDEANIIFSISDLTVAVRAFSVPLDSSEGFLLSVSTITSAVQSPFSDVSRAGSPDNSQVPKFLARGDIFIHPGRWPEPFGRVILEATQHNSPPVVSDIGAPPWIAGDAWVTFPRNDAGELVDQISELRGNPDILTEPTML